MSLFSRKNKPPKLKPFVMGVFGKLPFYKDFLFSSFHPAFSELRELIDQGMDRLIKAQNARPYVAPNRNLLLHVANHKMDLVASIWESDDGLRGFPFLLAASFPKKLKNAPFSVFWQGLQAYWNYFAKFHNEALGFSSPTDLYARVRGVQHQLPPLEIQDWELPESTHSVSRSATQSLDDGLLNPIDLTPTNAREEKAILLGLTPRQNPAFVMWPERGWRDDARLAVTAYLGTNGIEDLRVDFFLPEYRQEEDEISPDDEALLDSLPKEDDEESIVTEADTEADEEAEESPPENDQETDSSEADTQQFECLKEDDFDEEARD